MYFFLYKEVIRRSVFVVDVIIDFALMVLWGKGLYSDPMRQVLCTLALGVSFRAAIGVESTPMLSG